jgi:hypothetical protein
MIKRSLLPVTLPRLVVPLAVKAVEQSTGS